MTLLTFCNFIIVLHTELCRSNVLGTLSKKEAYCFLLIYGYIMWIVVLSCRYLFVMYNNKHI